MVFKSILVTFYSIYLGLTDNNVYRVLLYLIVTPSMYKSYEYFVGLIILSTTDILSAVMLK